MQMIVPLTTPKNYDCDIDDEEQEEALPETKNLVVEPLLLDENYDKEED